MEYFCRRNQKFGLLLCSHQFLVIFFKDFRCLKYAAISGTQYRFLLHRICSKTESKSKETECIVGVIDRPPRMMWDIPSEWSLSIHDQVGTTSCGNPRVLGFGYCREKNSSLQGGLQMDS
jgi:hypothetical protein